MHITKIFVNSGTHQIFPRESRNLARENLVGVWIDRLVRNNRQEKLPEPWSGYSATAADFQGGMVLSIYLGESDLLVQTIAIARHAAHGRPLWRVISALASQPDGGILPSKAWCAVLEHGETSHEHELEDFALACAWFWRTHGSKFNRLARGSRGIDEAIFRPAGLSASWTVSAVESADSTGLGMDTRPAADNADGHIIVKPDAGGENESLVLEIPHAGGNIQMTVPRSLLELCFSIDASDHSIDCINRNMPLFVAAAYSEYQQVSALSFELTESHIAGAQKNMALMEKSATRSAPCA